MGGAGGKARAKALASYPATLPTDEKEGAFLALHGYGRARHAHAPL